MLQEAKNIQNDAVDKLVNLLKNSRGKSLVFKAPTGSGKTYMIADLMNRVLSTRYFLILTMKCKIARSRDLDMPIWYKRKTDHGG